MAQKPSGLAAAGFAASALGAMASGVSNLVGCYNAVAGNLDINEKAALSAGGSIVHAAQVKPSFFLNGASVFAEHHGSEMLFTPLSHMA